MSAYDPMQPEDLEVREALDRLSAKPKADQDAKASLRAKLESFKTQLADHDYVRALDTATLNAIAAGDEPRRRTRLKVALLVFNDMVALDAVGPYEVLGTLGGVDFIFVGKERGTVRCARGRMGVVADASIDEVPHADMLLVPGGPGAEAMQHDPAVLDWVRRIHEGAAWTCSACTGSLILAAAGVLKNRPATTHWASLDRLAGYGALPQRQRVVVEDGIVTGAGVSAGIDLGLVVAALLRGEDAAQTVQLHLEYDPKPPFNSGSPATAPEHIMNSVMSRLSAARGGLK